MGQRFRQLVTGLDAPQDKQGGKRRPTMVEIDEDAEIINCAERFERHCVQVKPLQLLKVDVPGDRETQRLPVLVNDDVRIELLALRRASETVHDRADGWTEVHIGVENPRTSRTSRGDFALQPSDLLVVPSGVSHKSASEGPATRLIVATRRPMRVVEDYPVREQTAPGACLFLKPSEAADAVEEGVAGGKHFDLVANEDIRIEVTFRSDDQRIYHRGYGQDEVHFQLSGRRATRTSQGEYMLETGDMVLIPPGVSHRNVGGMPTTRIVLYAKHPLRVTGEYAARRQQAWGS